MKRIFSEVCTFFLILGLILAIFLPDVLAEEKTMEVNKSYISSVSLGLNHSAGITQDGSLLVWGWNEYGLGDGTTRSLDPIEIIDNVDSVSLGWWHSAAITKDGSLYLWGANYNGEIGDGTFIDRIKPVKIMEDVSSVSLGGAHTAAITNDGSLYLWGWNRLGQLGNGTFDDPMTTGRNTPIKIMDDVSSVSLGYTHSAAITKDGSLYVWGLNDDYHQLGDGTSINRNVPTKIMDNVASVSLGKCHSAAITNDGSLYVWGANGSGQVGDGTTIDRDTPTKILDNVKSVSLGGEHSAAITKDGSLYVWGLNYDGQLGNGTNVNSLKPVKVMDNIESVELGDSYTAAITKDGEYYSWGSNYSGELGDGTTENKYSPELLFVAASKVTLSNTSVSLSAGKSISLTATVSPSKAEQRITWESSNPEVVSVKNGLVSAIKAGSATITATSVDEKVFATCTVTVSQPIYRLYLPLTGEHLYTPDYNEYQTLYKNYGWGQEGIAWYSPGTGDAVYRLYNPSLKNHLYTTDKNEVKVLTSKHGWVTDNNGEALYYSGGSTSIYRIYNKGLNGLHHLTTDLNEYKTLGNLGWSLEGAKLKALALGEPYIKTDFYK